MVTYKSLRFTLLFVDHIKVIAVNLDMCVLCNVLIRSTIICFRQKKCKFDLNFYRSRITANRTDRRQKKNFHRNAFSCLVYNKPPFHFWKVD